MNKKILIISLGSAGHQHLKNLLKLDNSFEIGILRKNKNTLNIFGVKFFNKLADAQNFKPSAVIICSPASSHLFYLKKFYKICENFLIEKPLSNEFKEFNILYRKFNLHEKNIQIGYQLKFHPLLIELKKIIRSKKYGNVNHVSINTGQYLPYWREKNYINSVSSKKKLGGGVLMELSHEIDYTLWLFGIPHNIYSNFKKSSDLKINVEDVVDIIFDYGKYNINVHLDFINKISQREITIITSKGLIKANLISGEISFYDERNSKKIFTIKNKNINLKKIELEIFLRNSFKKYKVSKKKEKYVDSLTYFHNSFDTMRTLNEILKSNLQKKLINIKKN